MAEELQIRSNQVRVKVRNPLAVALLPYVTLGIYSVVWWYRVNCELRDYGRSRRSDLGQNPARSALAVFPGFLLVVPPIFTFYQGTLRVQEAARLAGREQVNGWICLILYLVFPPALFAYLQVSLNEVWRAEAGAASRRSLSSTGSPRSGAQPARDTVSAGSSR